MQRRLALLTGALLFSACIDNDPTTLKSPDKQLDHFRNPYFTEGAVGNFRIELDRGDFLTDWNGQTAVFNAGLVLGTSAGNVHFVNTRSGGNDIDFTGLAPDVETNSHGADLYTASVLGDDPKQNAGAKAALGVLTLRETFQYANSADDDYVIVRYSFTNTTNAALTNLQVGFLEDPDLIDGTNTTQYDAGTAIARVSHASGKQHGFGLVGRSVANYSHWINGAGGDPTNLNGWWSLFTSGLAVGSLSDEIRSYLGATSINLAAGETQTLVVVMGAGANGTELDANIAAGRAKAATLPPAPPVTTTTTSVQQLTSAFNAQITFASAALASAFDPDDAQCGGAPVVASDVNGSVVSVSFSENDLDARYAAGATMFCSGRLANGSYFAGSTVPAVSLPGVVTVTKLTSWTGFDTAPSVSPDGSKIAYVSSRFTGDPANNTQASLHIMNLTGDGSAVRVGTGVADRQPSWTPDGSAIVVSRGTGLFKVTVATGAATQILASGTGATDPRVSPDGTRVLYRRNNQMWTVPIGGGTQTQITTGTAANLYGEWVDNNTITFSRINGADESIWKATLSPYSEQRLTAPEAGAFFRFGKLSPDGQILAFYSSSSVVLQPIGSGYHTVARTSFPIHSDANHANIDWLPNGQKLVVAGGGGTIVDIYTITLPELRAPVTDPTAPVVTNTVSGTAGSNGWYTSDVSVDFTISDPESGAFGSGCGHRVVNTDGASTAVTCVATNGLGMQTSKTVLINRDASAPVIAFTGATSYTIDQNVGIVCSATDATSQIANATCPGAAGPAYTFQPSNTLNASATNNAGLTATNSATFTVAASVTSLQSLIDQWVSNNGQANSLKVKLGNGSTNAFINEVNAQRGKALTEVQADALIRWVKTL